MNIHGVGVGGANRCEPHQMLIWRDKKRGTKVFKVIFLYIARMSVII